MDHTIPGNALSGISQEKALQTIPVCRAFSFLWRLAEAGYLREKARQPS